jgi:16S rRNA (guanine(966)-N(2))-methyltransferase RsmD
MGIEALSRGARRAIFFEYSNEAYKILQKNLQTLSLQEASESFLGNSFDLFPQIMRSQSQKEKMIVYLDPPFAIRENQAEVYERCYALIQTLSPQNTLYIALEHMSQIEPPSQIGAFERLKTKKFGKSALSYYAALAHD